MAQQLFEDDFGLIRGRQVQLETEKLRDTLVTGEPYQEQHVRAERRRHRHGPVGLLVSRWHSILRRIRDSRFDLSSTALPLERV